MLYNIQKRQVFKGFLQILRAGEKNMSQVNVEQDIEQVKEHVNKLLAHVDELKKAIEELSEYVKTSEVVKYVEKLGEIRATLNYYILGKADEFSIALIDKCASANCEDIDVIVKRPNAFGQVITVKRDANLIEIYQRFFSNKKILEKLITDLVVAVMNLSKAVEKELDILSKIREMQGNIESISEELEDIKERIEDP
jgi:DNA-binding transcriptional regulator GbsR (MarR family)